MRHQLMITEPLPGVANSQPITRIVDANVYVRPDRGGLMLGGYEVDPKPVDVSQLPSSFRIEDLELDLSVLKRLAGLVKDQFPIFQTDVPLREHRGGLPTMTTDGEHILGEAPGVKGLYILGGCNVGGLSISPALGEETRGTYHQWSNNARPGADRFGTFSRPTCRNQTCRSSAAIAMTLLHLSVQGQIFRSRSLRFPPASPGRRSTPATRQGLRTCKPSAPINQSHRACSSSTFSSETSRLIAILDVEQFSYATPLLEVLEEAGIKTIEVTLRSSCALGVIETMAANAKQAVVGGRDTDAARTICNCTGRWSAVCCQPCLFALACRRCR